MTSTVNDLLRGKDLRPWQTPVRWCLVALSVLYRVAVWLRNLAYELKLSRAVKVSIPVISVGNISVGGTGKTPFCAWLASELASKGKRVAVLSRGYKGVDGRNDEAIELERKGISVFCNPDRVTEAKLRESEFDIFILDDGFQHRRLARQLDIVLIDSTSPPWKDRLLPAGLLREPLGSLERADVLVVTRTNIVPDAGKVLEHLGSMLPGKFLTSAELVADSLTVASSGEVKSTEFLKGKKVYLFCGIGNPEQFVALVRHVGANVIGLSEFPDHHHYKPSEIVGVVNDAESAGAEMVVTTAKDWVKCHSVDHFGKIHILNVRFRPIDRDGLLSKIFALTGD
ncbi:MAG: tetraacyldisaccharide 4'-kinase [Planctomycetota bacterium]